MKRTFHRRDFLKKTTCGLIGSVSMMDTILNFNLANSLSSSFDEKDYKALVCIFLHGGNDSFNMLIPTRDEEYVNYATSRANLALSLPSSEFNNLQSAIRLNGNSNGRTYGVHASMEGVKELYDQNKLAFVANVGTLIEPLSIGQFKSKSRQIPSSLFSHNSQREQWQTGVPQKLEKTGWMGRATELIMDNSNDLSYATNISFNGNNIMQTGRKMIPYCIGENGAINFNSVAGSFMSNLDPDASNQESILKRVYEEIGITSQERYEHFQNTYNQINVQESHPNNSLAKTLTSVAKTIATGIDLQKKRQTFFVVVPQWDTHQDLIYEHAKLLEMLSEAMFAFNSQIQALNLENNVITFTASDFGRTLRSNGRGSDHGWGGNMIVMGESIKKANVYGHYPEKLLLGDGLDVGNNGRLLPTVSCDEYFCELLTWFGVPPSQMSTVLPNIRNFYEPKNKVGPLGIF